MARKIEIGDKVRYSGKFLRSTGQHRGLPGQARGIVTALTPFCGSDLATIDWDCDMPDKVITANLEKCRP